MPDTLPSKFLKLIDESLASSPERGDLWMMRFDALRSLDARAKFARSVQEAQADPVISRQLNWIELRSMWDEMAPGEPFPEGADVVEQDDEETREEALLPPLVLPDRRGIQRKVPPPLRRFRDVAQYVAAPELRVLAKAYSAISVQPGFLEGFMQKSGALLARPTPLEFSQSLSVRAGEGRRVYLKREDKRGVSVEAEHAASQCYIASALGKTTVVTGNDVDGHVLQVATMAPYFGLKCTVVVRPEDFNDKPHLIKELEALDAKVEPVPEKGMIGTDPREGAVHLWKRSAGSAHLVLSLGMAPQPHTSMANAFQSLVGREAESQYTGMAGQLERPRTVVAAVGSEADSIGFALPYLGRRDVQVVYAEPEPGGPQVWRPSKRLAPYNGQIREHTWLRGIGRIQYVAASDESAAEMRRRLACEGIEVGLEDARAVAASLQQAQEESGPRDFLVLVG